MSAWKSLRQVSLIFPRGAEHINLLSGLLFDQHGQKFTSADSSKKGIRYGYYVSSHRSSTSASTQRIPAGDIERLVVESIIATLNDERWLQSSIATIDATQDTIAETTGAAKEIAEHIANADTRIVQQQLRQVVRRIEVSPDTLAILLDGGSLLHQDGLGGERKDSTLRMEIPNPFGGKHQTMDLLVRPDGQQSGAPTKWLVKAIARSVTWYEDIASGRAASLREIAQAEGVDERFVAKVLPLAFLAPGLVSECLEGRPTLSLTASDLAAGVDLPLAWADQRT